MDYHSPLLWIGFNAYIIVMLALSLFAHRGQHEVSLKESALWSLFWVGNAAAVNAYVWVVAGQTKGLEFLTGFILEQSLSVDNLFVILTIFAYFAIPPVKQHRVLFWGILGAILMRGAFIVLGSALVERFQWILYLFGVFLIWTAWKLFRQNDDEEIHPDRNLFVRVFRRFMPVTTHNEGMEFFVKQGGRWAATPMFVALVVVESSDVMFAVDSIPAIFSITTDPFIVYASNICAVLGLRSLYFLLQGVLGMFRYLKYGLALILGFVGVKMLIVDLVHIPVAVSLGVVAGILGGAVATSLFRPKPPPPPPTPPHDPVS